MKNGRLIVVEGSDGSGKETQSKLLADHLINEGHNVLRVTFPDYESDSSALVKSYLRGDFGEKADDVNIYAASTFYAVDRFASFKQKWGKFYEDGGIIVADRYTTSNMIHQTAKLGSFLEKDNFVTWLWDLEFNLFNLPVPDQVVFLDVPPVVSEKLRNKRVNKITKGEQKDIHERDLEYMKKSYNTSLYIADRFDWDVVLCSDNGKMKSIDEIHLEVVEKVSI